MESKIYYVAMRFGNHVSGTRVQRTHYVTAEHCLGTPTDEQGNWRGTKHLLSCEGASNGSAIWTTAEVDGGGAKAVPMTYDRACRVAWQLSSTGREVQILVKDSSITANPKVPRRVIQWREA